MPLPPQAPPAEKALALTEMHHAVYQAIDTALRGTSKEALWVLVDVYPLFAVIGLNNTFFRVPYAVEGNSVTLSKRAEWVEVMREWLDIVPQETIVAVGDEIKALGDGRIGGYLVRFTDERSPDLQGDYFTKATDFGPHQQSLIFYHHGDDPQVGKRPLGVKMATLTPNDIGVWLDAQLDMRDEYERYIYRLVEMGKAGFSSGTAPHLVERMWTGKAHHISKWYLGLDASITPTPAAGPHLTQVLPLKSFTQANPVTPLKALLQELGDSSTASAEEAEEPAEQEEPLPENTPLPSPTAEEFDMDEEKLKALLEGSIKAAIAPLQAEVATLKKALEDEPPTNDPGPALPAGTGQPPAEEGMPYYLKYGTETAAKAQVLKELAGGNYELVNLRMTQALVKALRQPDSLSLEERKLLSNQIFAPTHIELYLKEGASVRTIKDMQQVAQGQLGGYAMPPQMQENIVSALPGVVAMRKYGARVVTLLQGDTYTVTVYKNNSDQYIGTLRGQWGGEKNTATEQNFKTEEVDVKVNPYNYKISLTNNVLMFTANLVQMLEQDVVETMSMDEENTFWTGDGVNKPLGWLPGGQNSLGLKEVPSGHASTLTTDGITKLKRGVPTQYRDRGIFVGNSDTYGTVETLTVSGTGSDKAYPSLPDAGTLLRRPAAEAGGLPDVAANSYPLLFGDPRGYTIVETPGFTLQRMQDTRTGLTKAEIHVLKYTGGRPVQLYYFAVQKVTAS